MEKANSLVEKLGISKSSKIALISPFFENPGPISFEGHLAVSATPKDISDIGSGLDTIIVWVENRTGLKELILDLKKYLSLEGSLWIVIKKGSAFGKEANQYVTENDIITTGKEIGMMNERIVSISNTEYAFRLIKIRARGEG